MKYLYLSFIFNILNHNKRIIKPKVTCELKKESFVGSWVVYEKEKEQIIHLQPSGSIYKQLLSNNKNELQYIGGWDINDNSFFFNIKDKKYYGKINNDSLKIIGNVCEGLYSPCYITNFTLLPLFEQFHNITFVNKTDNIVYLNQKNVTGKWILENLYTNQLYILELHKNNTWNSIYSDNLHGKWNLFNESINTNIVTNLAGKNVWLSIKPYNNQGYSNNDIMFIGKITQLGKTYNISEKDKKTISSKINGSVVYCYDMEPEISETFYMKRWF